MHMPTSYEDIMARRLARLTPEELAQREVFRSAYEIAVQVIDLRQKHGLTQVQLAERCGVHQADISRIERGSVDPRTRTLQRIAEALDADVRLVSRTP
jgi:DNA-binding XRE family transcriptional regulator